MEATRKHIDGGAPRLATSAFRWQAGGAARVLLRLGMLTVMGAGLAACDKCGRITQINKPWSAACEQGPVTR